MDKIKIYSPRQIFAGSMLGGPFTMTYELKKNADALGNKKGSRNILLGGALFSVALIGGIPFLPDKFPNMVIPLAYSLTAQFIAEKQQMTKEAIRTSEQYDFQSNWKVFGVGMIGLVAFLIIFVILIFGASAMGLIHLEDN